MSDLTRRDFVATTALGVAGLWRGAPALAHDRTHNAELLMYVGTYTEGGRKDGIYLVRMDSATGALRKVDAADGGSNPSFLTIHPDGRTLYAVNEVAVTQGRGTGSVRAFAIDAASGELTLRNERMSEGTGPCYVSTDLTGEVVLVANYGSGTVAMLPVQPDGSLVGASQAVKHVGKGPVTSRQEAAHAHCIIPLAGNKFAIAADLGVDRVLVYRLEIERNMLVHLEPADAELKPGTGPRHLATHPTLPLVYVSGELNSTVTLLRVNAATGALTVGQTLSTVPALSTVANYPADIHVSADGRTCYVSNRGHNSIAVYSIAPNTGALTLRQHVSTGGDWPRNFTIDPTGQWLLVANQRSGSVVVFARDPMNGQLTATSQRIELPSPVCLRFQTA